VKDTHRLGAGRFAGHTGYDEATLREPGKDAKSGMKRAKRGSGPGIGPEGCYKLPQPEDGTGGAQEPGIREVKVWTNRWRGAGE
jgi:hypothetical protein